MKRIIIAKDFSDVPAGRYLNDGPYSGQHFRDTYLVPALNQGEKVEIILDGAEGYGSSFLEEVFGGLVRETNFDKNFISANVVVTANSSEYEFYKDLALEFISTAIEEKTNEAA